MKVICVIPARHGSTRLAGKPLVDICGKPMIQYVYDAALAAPSINEVYIATDDQRIIRAVENFSGNAYLTSPDHNTGTDRVAEVARALNSDIIVNVQGDEPLLKSSMIDAVIRPLMVDSDLPMSTLCVPITSEEKLRSPHVVKVVFDVNGHALYFSRSLVPYPRSDNGYQAYEHLGLYAYRTDFLLQLVKLPQTRLEINESLEQLRALESGFRIGVAVSTDEYTGLSVDTQEDLDAVRLIVQAQINDASTKLSAKQDH